MNQTQADRLICRHIDDRVEQIMFLHTQGATKEALFLEQELSQFTQKIDEGDALFWAENFNRDG